MDIRPKLQSIFKEYKDLFIESTNINEVQKMKRFKEENQAKSDTQANPTSANTPLPANDAGELKKDTPQNDKGIQKENESGKDTQAAPPQAVQASDGTPPKQDASQNDKDMQKEQMQTIPAAPEDEEEIKEKAAPGEKDLKEKFAEMEGDMGKVVDVVEALKNQIEAMNQRMTEMEGKIGKQPGEEQVSEEPQAPVTESAILKGAFAESIAYKEDSHELGKAMSNFLKRT